jgi:hypothetical protein
MILRAMRPPQAVALALAVSTVLACAPASPGPTATPTAASTPVPSAGSPSLTPAPTPAATIARPTVVPRPSGTLAWPTAFDVEFEQATYFSSPPFDVPFTLEVDEPGWFSGHLNGEFFDLLRFDGVPHTGLPTRMLTFGVPGHVRGPDGDVPVQDLTAEAAADLIEQADDRTTSNRMDIELLGLTGVVLDIHSELNNTPIYGGAAGNFGLSPERDVRLAILAHADGFLLVGMLAEAGDLDAAWEHAEGILDTVRFVE